MTWSIIARDPATGAFGVAVSTKFFAAGALCPHASGGIGALATQALINPGYGPRGLRLLAEGISATHVVAALIDADDGRDQRQLHVIDRHGTIAQHTGPACIDWAGHVAGADHSVAGNMLAGPQVVAETSAAYLANAKLPFARRLIAAMQAGEAAGGDKRGKQSAGLKVYTTEEWPDLDLRVDDHAEPLLELARLERVSRERYVHFRPFLPTRANPAGITSRAEIEAGIAAALADASDGRAG
ncbi:MAG: DUF1028 domain-containing protein [Rhodospirillaceae bacterium]|nr:DUF1028 domain-containing protein [Rhodospirillaceae bacterium]